MNDAAITKKVVGQLATSYNVGLTNFTIDYAKTGDYYEAYAWRYDGSATVGECNFCGIWIGL